MSAGPSGAGRAAPRPPSPASGRTPRPAPAAPPPPARAAPAAPARGPPGVAQLDAGPPRSRRRPGRLSRAFAPGAGNLEGRSRCCCCGRSGTRRRRLRPVAVRRCQRPGAPCLRRRPHAGTGRRPELPAERSERGAAGSAARRARGERADFVLVLQDSATCHSSRMVPGKPPQCFLSPEIFLMFGETKGQSRTSEHSAFRVSAAECSLGSIAVASPGIPPRPQSPG